MGLGAGGGVLVDDAGLGGLVHRGDVLGGGDFGDSLVGTGGGLLQLLVEGLQAGFNGLVAEGEALGFTGGTGFGYDPLFLPDGYSESFAQLGDAVKNELSHRGRAWTELVAWMRACLVAALD